MLAKIQENFDAFMGDLSKKRPSDVKGDFVKSVAISSTMGPGVKVDGKGVRDGGKENTAE